MNEIEAVAALARVEKYLETPRSRAEIDRACAMIDEIYQKHIDYLAQLISEVSPDYVPMESE